MAAGLGSKTFATGDVLSAADVNGYLMQGVLVFASAAARDAAITAPAEGQFAFLKDTNATVFYDGAAWVASGGGSPLTTKGDLYTFDTDDARLPVGANDTILVADSSTATGLKWAAPAGGGGKVLQVVNATHATEASSSSSSFIDTGLTATITPTLATSKVLVFVHQTGLWKNDGSAASELNIKLVRAATDLAAFEIFATWTASVQKNNVGGSGVTFLDSPATTSATTYKTQFRAGSGGAVFVNGAGSRSSITLMEIGA